MWAFIDLKSNLGSLQNQTFFSCKKRNIYLNELKTHFSEVRCAMNRKKNRNAQLHLPMSKGYTIMCSNS